MSEGIDNLAREMVKPMLDYPGTTRAIVMLHDEDHAVTAIYGYDTDEEAIADVVVHVKHLLARHGVNLIISPFEATGGPN